MTTDPKILDYERRLAQLESAGAQLNAALEKRAVAPEVPAPAPLPAIVVEETKLTSTMSELPGPKSSVPSPGLPAGRIKLWVVYQSALQEIEVDGNLA